MAGLFRDRTVQAPTLLAGLVAFYLACAARFTLRPRATVELFLPAACEHTDRYCQVVFLVISS